MSYKPPYQSFKAQQKKKKVYGPLIVGGISVILVAAGIFLIWMWLSGSGGIELAFLNTETPTPTNTATPLPPTPTATETLIPSETLPPTEAPTSTAAAPFSYIVEPGDTLSSIAEKFDVEEVLIIMVLNNMTADDVLFVGQELIIPDPNTGIPSPSPIPGNLAAGDIIQYMVLPGDTIKIIAEKFQTTEDAIIEASGLDNPNLIYPGQILQVPVRLITPTFGPPPTTETPGTAQTGTPTGTTSP